VVYDQATAPVRMWNYLMPPWFTVRQVSEDDTPHFEIRYEVRNGEPQCRSVQVWSPDDSGEVLRSHLRALDLGGLLEDAIQRVALIVREVRENGVTLVTHAGDTAELASVTNAGRKARRGITPELLAEVAEVYQAHEGRAPTQAVAEHFGKSLRTGTYYVKAAREHGYLNGGQS
jgi:hypothetical protein